MDKIRLGVIGTGFAWERLHLPVLQKLSNEFEIKALSGLNLTDAENCAMKLGLGLENVYHDYREMLQREDIDAIDIVVPIEHNYEVSLNVARSGKHFICEKPLAQNMQEAQKYLQLKKNYHVQILIAENFRYDEEHNLLKQFVHEQRVGEVVYFTYNNIFSFPEEMRKDTYAAKEWRQHPVYYGAAFLDGAVHDIAAMRHIFGDVMAVQAFGKPQSEDFSPFVSINCNIQFKSGVIGQYTFFPSGVETQSPRSGFRIYGKQGNLYLENKTCGVLNAFYANGNTEQIVYTPGMGYYNEFLNFYKGIIGQETIQVTPEVEYGDAKMIFDILRSINTQEIIAVDGIGSSEHLPIEFYGNIHQYLQ